MYVIKNKRLADFLYTLGLNYTEQKDRTNRQDKVYLFTQSEKLFEAITFYTNFKNKYMKTSKNFEGYKKGTSKQVRYQL